MAGEERGGSVAQRKPCVDCGRIEGVAAVQALHQSNSGAYRGRVGSVSTTVQGSTALGAHLAPPRRLRLNDVSPQVMIYAMGIVAGLLFWNLVDHPANDPVNLCLFAAALLLAAVRVYRVIQDKKPYRCRLAIWREFLVCAPCNVAFLTGDSCASLGLSVAGWRAEVPELKNAVRRLATRGR